MKAAPYTIPPKLTEELAKYYLEKDYLKYLPTNSSAQNLADDANRIGALIHIKDNLQWIGSPLRVHRRCLDPMFSIANEIAYENKMINARTGMQINTSDILGNSSWFHVTGETTDGQYVRNQGILLLQILAKLYDESGHLPKLFIITPFRKVKANIINLIKDPRQWRNHLNSPIKLPSESKLNTWAKQRIGTIHTFQGKEEDAVILVLGVDQNSQGSANWAASKPNLLNVALTRAKNNIYVIGDKTVWSNKNYFNLLVASLK